jgi:hypothetical protein
MVATRELHLLPAVEWYSDVPSLPSPEMQALPFKPMTRNSLTLSIIGRGIDGQEACLLANNPPKI